MPFLVGTRTGIAEFDGGIPINNGFLLPFHQYHTKLLFHGEIGIHSRWQIYDSKKTYYELQEKKQLETFKMLQAPEIVLELWAQDFMFCAHEVRPDPVADHKVSRARIPAYVSIGIWTAVVISGPFYPIS